jgi:pimeloyl-ACP methyl ester carboxylesterase
MQISQLKNGSFEAVLNSFRIHYEVHGSGPPLMTLPNSWGLSLNGLRALYRPLEAKRTLVYFDPRGMGKSASIRRDSDMGMAAVRSDLDALRLHLKLDRVDVIGWSNGATNLILLAGERPEILRSAIILHTASRFSEDDMGPIAKRFPDWIAGYAALQQELDREDLDDAEKNLKLKQFNLDTGFANLFADAESGRRVLQASWNDVGFSYRHAAYLQRELPTYDFRDRLGSISVRSLVMAGAHDLLPLSRAEEIYQGIANAEFEAFHQSAHFAPLEETEAFISRVFDFLDTK